MMLRQLGNRGINKLLNQVRVVAAGPWNLLLFPGFDLFNLELALFLQAVDLHL